MSKIVEVNVQSEIGKLNGVILHTPGEEVENMTPENAERALYSDILNLSIARKEYKQLSEVLGKITKTYQVKDLLTNILKDDAIKLEVLNRIEKIEPFIAETTPKGSIKDQLLDDKKQSDDDDKKKGSKRDNLIRHLFKIQRNIELYNDKQFNEFLRRTDYPPIRTISDKRTLKNNIETLINVGDKTIEEVINDAHEMHICLIDEKLERFKLEKGYVYDRVKAIKYSEFQKLYEYLEGKTPFSTQHKTKGAEFDNVLVVLDNGGWNNYNFESVFVDNRKSETVKSRSLKIFYVCCTRTKENLAVFYHMPSVNVIAKAQEWFGADNVIKL